MRTLALSRSLTVTLDGSGDGTAQLGPTSPGELWLPSVISVGTDQLSSAITNEAQCKVYCGAVVSQPNFVDGTLSGSTGDSTGNAAGQQIHPGQYVWAVWSGGDAGVQATVQVQGTRQVP